MLWKKTRTFSHSFHRPADPLPGRPPTRHCTDSLAPLFCFISFIKEPLTSGGKKLYLTMPQFPNLCLPYKFQNEALQSKQPESYLPIQVPLCGTTSLCPCETTNPSRHNRWECPSLFQFSSPQVRQSSPGNVFG